ncbi:GntR family transcriptional regulator [cf. Phormidesmis sp. LEGE 11477]|uniref:GntR family transcriptional regulator n=1 Tax=cf. Phormidesmis sp. LEGE 11477 TaxID=1828680 RepID=UPI00187F60BD|nr:GntR family transcriptional regulator [cf. Phormidesmis sp. LEGE 11477]MBE9064778.1 GntR family transcriptional regulator [cf. Phormidesmis sp. LEGE 11477]
MDAPARSSHLFEQIHEILWHKILGGEIEPMQRLKDVEWAKRLGVSRTPVREAMRKMQQEGILIPLSQGGYEVRAVSVDDLHGLYRCRSALEVQAIREAFNNFSPKTQNQFEVLIRKADKAIDKGDFDKVFQLNSEFHRTLIELSQNTHLVGLCETLQKLILYYRSALLNRVKSDSSRQEEYIKRLQTKQVEHRAIIDALAEQDVERAAELMQCHLLETAQHMES